MLLGQLVYLDSSAGETPELTGSGCVSLHIFDRPTVVVCALQLKMDMRHDVTPGLLSFLSTGKKEDEDERWWDRCSINSNLLRNEG